MIATCPIGHEGEVSPILIQRAAEAGRTHIIPRECCATCQQQAPPYEEGMQCQLGAPTLVTPKPPCNPRTRRLRRSLQPC